jgi:hypothetical protein
VLAAGTCRLPGSPAQSWGLRQQALLLQVLALHGTSTTQHIEKSIIVETHMLPLLAGRLMQQKDATQ